MRRFAYVPFGGRAGDASIACDGLVDGAALDLSHWSGNRTPAPYKRDTSTESALAYATSAGADAALATVTNNHFDTDGVLSVWALVEPEAAARHAALLVAGAEAGDFGEWPEDERGLWLDFAIDSLGERFGDDRATYAGVLPLLADVVAHLEERGSLWQTRWEALLQARARAESGAVEVSRHGAVALFVHRADTDEMPGPVLARLAPPGAMRWLLAWGRGDGVWDYRYERPPWAWADTVKRPNIATPSRNAVARQLGPGWALKGGLGMTGICRTSTPCRVPPARIAETFARSDPGLKAIPAPSLV
jgi:hypothetical protein